MFYRLAERLFVMAALFFYTGALAPFISKENPLAGPKENLPILCAWITVFLITAHWEKVLPTLFQEKTLWLLLLLTACSVGWSDIPLQSREFVIPLLRVSLFGLYFSTRFSLREQLQLLALTLGAIAIGSAVFGALLPTYGVMGVGFIANSQDTTHTGAWRGLFIHKTVLGSMMVLTGLICWANWLDSRHQGRSQGGPVQPLRGLPWLYRAGVAIAALVLWMSTTKGAILVLLIAMALLPFYRSFRWSYFRLIPFGILSTLFGTLALTGLIGNAEHLLGLIGREVTISGRTIYWPIMWQELKNRLWWGFGYEAFWQGGWRGEVGTVWRYLLPGNEPPHAHNGYLMIWFDIGLVGLCLFGLNFVLAYVNALRFVRLEPTAIGLAPVTYLTVTLLFNLTESYLMRPDLFWILYMSSILSVHRGLLHQQWAQQRAQQRAHQRRSPYSEQGLLAATAQGKSWGAGSAPLTNG